MRKGCAGFGYDPKETSNHFYIVKPKERTEPVEVYERFAWADAPETAQPLADADVLKLVVPRKKWNAVQKEVTAEFNRRLKAAKKPIGKFAVGGTAVERQLGKELLVLLWGIEHNEVRGIPRAIRNWLGLQPEERWWLYTMTNATSGKLGDKRGWRMALRYILCENPVEEAQELDLIQPLPQGEGDRVSGGEGPLHGKCQSTQSQCAGARTTTEGQEEQAK